MIIRSILNRVMFYSNCTLLVLANPTMSYQKGNEYLPESMVQGVENNGTSQGSSVAFSQDGTILIIGSEAQTSVDGAVWIFVRKVNKSWQQQCRITPVDAIGIADFGHSLSLSTDGTTLAIGGPKDNASGTTAAGAVWIYMHKNNEWQEQQKITVDSVNGAYFGDSVVLSRDGNILVVGGPGDNDYAGAAWIFVRNNGFWAQQEKITVPGSMNLGASVSFSPDMANLAIGAPANYPQSNNTGEVWLFNNVNGSWQQTQSIKGFQPDDAFGSATAFTNATLVIGSPQYNNSTGNAWLACKNDNQWSISQVLNIIDSIGQALIGFSLSAASQNDVIALGAPKDSEKGGAVFIFQKINDTWVETQKVLPVFAGIEGGTAVALDAKADYLAVGEPLLFVGGAVEVFERIEHVG